MDSSILEGMGMSNTEIKVFIRLLEIGESKAGIIIKETGLQSSSVYNIINSLMKKGLVSYIKKGQIKYYKAAAPEVLLDYLDTKKKEYLSLLPELKERQKRVEEEGVEFFKSFRGIKTITSELMKDAKKGDIYRFFSIQNPEKYRLAVEKVYSAEKQLRAEKKIVTRGIFHESIREFAKRSSITHKRFLKFPMPPNTLMINNKVAIISWKGEPSGILIRSKDIFDTYVGFFEHLWKIAKK